MKFQALIRDPCSLLLCTLSLVILVAMQITHAPICGGEISEIPTWWCLKPGEVPRNSRVPAPISWVPQGSRRTEGDLWHWPPQFHPPSPRQGWKTCPGDGWSWTWWCRSKSETIGALMKWTKPHITCDRLGLFSLTTMWFLPHLTWQSKI
jgi:hypothetical protein